MNTSTSPWFPDRTKKFWGDHSWILKVPECRDPEHDPSRHLVYPDGEHTHTCPSCGSRFTIVVERPRW